MRIWTECSSCGCVYVCVDGWACMCEGDRESERRMPCSQGEPDIENEFCQYISVCLRRGRQGNDFARCACVLEKGENELAHKRARFRQRPA